MTKYDSDRAQHARSFYALMMAKAARESFDPFRPKSHGEPIFFRADIERMAAEVRDGILAEIAAEYSPTAPAELS